MLAACSSPIGVLIFQEKFLLLLYLTNVNFGLDWHFLFYLLSVIFLLQISRIFCFPFNVKILLYRRHFFAFIFSPPREREFPIYQRSKGSRWRRFQFLERSARLQIRNTISRRLAETRDSRLSQRAEVSQEVRSRDDHHQPWRDKIYNFR